MPIDPEQQPRPQRGLVLTLLRPALPLLLVMLGAAIAGCGSSQETGTTADPASAVPASAPLYGGAVVRPDGSLKSAATSAGRTLTHQTDPYLSLVALLQTPGSAALSFDHDVAPWLGPRAGIFFSTLGRSGKSNTGQLFSLLSRGLLGGSPSASAFPFAPQGAGAGAAGGQGAIVMDTSDLATARSFLESQAQHAGAHATSYRGVSYQTTSAGLAFAIVDRFAVIGSDAAVRGVIDTTLGGPSLARSAGYAKLLAVAPAGTLAHLFVSPAPHASSAATSAHGEAGSGASSAATGASGASGTSAASPTSAGSGTSAGLSGLLGLLVGTRETNVSLVPASTSIALDADSLGTSASASGGLLASVSQGAQAAGELPGESWLAVGLGDVGATLGGDVQGLRALTSLGGSLTRSSTEASATSAFSLKGLLEGILAPLSVLGANSAEARRDFAGWMGSGGIFASGSGLAELRAGIVINSTNPTLSNAAVSKLAALLRKGGTSVQTTSYPGASASIAVYLNGIPITLNIVNARDAKGQTKFVIGLGEPSVATALNPPSTLSNSATFNAARTVLTEGIQPSLTVDFPTLLGLLEAVGFTEDPTISKLLPYARTLTTLSGGGKSLGEGIERFRMVLGLQQTG